MGKLDVPGDKKKQQFHILIGGGNILFKMHKLTMTSQNSNSNLFPDPMPRRQAGVPGSASYKTQIPELSPGIIAYC
jgi:hypothetical protein